MPAVAVAGGAAGAGATLEAAVAAVMAVVVEAPIAAAAAEASAGCRHVAAVEVAADGNLAEAADVKVEETWLG